MTSRAERRTWICPCWSPTPTCCCSSTRTRGHTTTQTARVDPAQPPPPCGLAVPDQANNPGLMRDCINLLAAKDALRGTATLNWSVDTPISDWDGVKVSGSPARVTSLVLVSEGLTGTIPPELGRLDGLEYLWLGYNQLTGEIPAALGGLASLKSLLFNRNRLTGAVPRELGGLSRLESLWLNENQLSGEIPASLGDLNNLRQLLLAGNRLSGAIPSVLGDLSNLEHLKLNYNQLTGEIPSALGRPEQSEGPASGRQPADRLHPARSPQRRGQRPRQPRASGLRSTVASVGRPSAPIATTSGIAQKSLRSRRRVRDRPTTTPTTPTRSRSGPATTAAAWTTSTSMRDRPWIRLSPTRR